MKQILLALCLLAGTYGATAQNNKSEEIMARAERQIYKTRSSEAKFSSVYYDEQGKAQSREQGTIYLQGEKFRLEYGDIIAVYDGKTMTHHDAGEETLTISQPSNEELLQINPLHFLRSRAKGFGVQSKASKAGVETLVYTPKGKSNIKQVSIGYRHSDGMPATIQIYSKDNRYITLELKSFKAQSTDYPQTKFELKKSDFPKSELVDLR